MTSVVIANFNGERYLHKCLTSVLACTYKKFELIIVDDGSTDKSLEIIKTYISKDKRIKFIRNSKNIGAAGSRNKAIQIADGEIVVFLDNDTEVDRDWLSQIIVPFSKDINIGGVQSLLFDFEDRELIQMAGGYLIPHTGWLIPFYQWKRYEVVKTKLKEENIVGISAALAVRKSVLRKIYGFDEKEAIYTEDLDLCWRIWISGYRIVLAPRSHVFHWTKSVVERSGMKASYRQIYYNLAKNSFRSILKNYEFGNVLKYLPFSILINLGRGFTFLLSRRNSDALIGSLLGLFWFFRNLPETISTRMIVQKDRKFGDEYLMKRIFTSKSLTHIYDKYFRK